MSAQGSDRDPRLGFAPTLVFPAMPTKQKRPALAPTLRRGGTTAKAGRPRSTRPRPLQSHRRRYPKPAFRSDSLESLARTGVQQLPSSRTATQQRLPDLVAHGHGSGERGRRHA